MVNRQGVTAAITVMVISVVLISALTLIVPPFFVYFIAFEIRFRKIVLSISESANRLISLSSEKDMVILLLSAVAFNVL